MSTPTTTALNDWNRIETTAMAMAALASALEVAGGFLHGFTGRSVAVLLPCGGLVFTTLNARNYRILYERRRGVGTKDDVE